MGAIYVQKDGQQYGPLTRDELQPYLDAGVLSVEDWAVEEGGAEWVPLGNLLRATVPAEDVAVIPEAFREQTEIKVDLETGAEPVPGAMADVSSGRKKIAVAVIVLGMLGGGTALGFYFTQDTHPESPPPPGKPSSLADLLKTTVGDSSLQSEELPPLELPATRPVPLPLTVNAGGDFQKAAEAAKAGHPVDAFHLAVRLHEGWGGALHASQAVTNAELSEANNNGPAAAKIFLGFLYMNSRTPPAKLANVPKLFTEKIEKAAKAEAARPDPYAHYVLGLRELPTRGYRGDLPRALHHFAAAGRAGFPPALYQLGQLHLRGMGVPRNPRKATEYFAAAGQAGHTEALRLLGLMYLRGDGLVPNPAESVRLTEAAARIGNPSAQFGMAVLLDQGKITDANQTAACQWFMLAAMTQPTAGQHVLRLKNQLKEEEFQTAVDLAKAINPDVAVPYNFPTPPGIAKPAVSNLGQPVDAPESPVPDNPSIIALKGLLVAMGKRDSAALWAAMPVEYQADANAVAKLAGQRLNPAMHAALVNVLRHSKTLFADQKEFLKPVLEQQDDVLPDEALQKLPLLVDAILASPLADAEWLAEPELGKLFEGQLLQHLIEGAAPFEAGDQLEILSPDLMEATVRQLDGNATAASLQVTLGEREETWAMQKVDGKWVPAELAKAWPEWLAAAREALKAPADGGVGVQEQVIIMLGALEGILKSLNAAQTQDEFNERFMGLLELLPEEVPGDEFEPAPNPLPPLPPEGN